MSSFYLEERYATAAIAGLLEFPSWWKELVEVGHGYFIYSS